MLFFIISYFLICILFRDEMLPMLLCVSGSGQMEEPEEEYFPGPYQKGGGEEDDGAVDDRRLI